MARWRHLIFDAISREPQAEIPVVVGCSFSEVLDSPGAASVTMPLDPSDYGVTKDMILPPRAIYGVERNDVLVWAGPVLTHQYDLRARTVTLGCEGWWNYIRRRFLVNTLNYIAMDQTLIAQSLLDYAESWAGGDFQINYTAGWSLSGVTRDRTFWYYEHGSIGTLIEQLAAVDNGFNWKLIPAWTAGPNSAMELQFHTRYPATGRATNIILDLDANVAVEEVMLDASNLSYVAIVEGLGQGELQTSAIRTNAPKITANVRLESVETRADVSVAATLDAYARQRLTRGSDPIMSPRLNVSTDLLDELIIGDRVRVRADMGLLELDATYRIVKWDVSPGDERMTLELAPLTAFTP
jgi:hypothetical protein